MVRKLRNYFFGPEGSSYKKFSKQNEPDKNMYQELFNSQAFIAEVNDTAKTSEQGLIKLQTDAESIARTSPTAGDFAKAVQAHQLPEAITTLGGGDANDGAALTGRGISIQPVIRTIGSITRRIWKFANTLIFTSSDTTIGITEAVPGTVDFTLKITSAGGTVTPTVIAGGYNLEVTPGVGPAGIDSSQLQALNELNTRCTSLGVPIAPLPTTLVSLWQGTTHIDLTSLNLADVTVFNPIVSNCTATYAHSGFDILVTLTATSADAGSVLMQIKYGGVWYTKNVVMNKIYAGTAGTLWVDKGELTAAPANPSDYWWYKNPNTRLSYYYEGGAWKILFDGRSNGPTEYRTLTNAGLVLALTNADKANQIIHVPAGVVLAGPITITTSGTFSDGFNFNIFIDGGFDSNGETVTILGKSITQMQCLSGLPSINGVYSLTGNTWMVRVLINDVWEAGIGTHSIQTIGTYCEAKANYSVAYGAGSVSNIYASKAFASYYKTTPGDAQEIFTILRALTTTNVASRMELSNGTDGIIIPEDCTANVSIRLIAVQTDGIAGSIGDSFSQNIKLCVKNIANTSSIVTHNGATLANYSVVTSDIVYELSSCDAAFAGTVSVSVASNVLHINITGETNKEILWIAKVSLLWIGYNNFAV